MTVGESPGTEPIAFYTAGDHYSETLRRNTIGADAARAAMSDFVATGRLSPDLAWEQVQRGVGCAASGQPPGRTESPQC